MPIDSTMEVVISGLGVLSPIGIGRENFWTALCDGRSGIVHDAAATIPCRATLPVYSARDFIHSAQLRRADDLSRMIAVAARMAVDDAALDLTAIAPDRVGVVVGSAIANVRETVPYLEKLLTKGPALASPLTFSNLVHNAAASYTAMELAATGINLTLAEDEISAEKALAMAMESIRLGRADFVIAGGGDDYAVELVADAYRKHRLLAGTGGRDGRCSPYDQQHGGIAPGQGAAMLLLESADSARRRGVRPYARLGGCFEHSVLTPGPAWPRGDATAIAALRSFLDNRTDGRPIDAVIGSANGSGYPDEFEIDLVRDAVATTQPVHLTSIKGAIGEFGAAGALAAAAACLSLRHGLLPPLCNLRSPLDDPSLHFPAGRAVASKLTRALTLGSARGGGIAALLWDRPSSED